MTSPLAALDRAALADGLAAAGADGWLLFDFHGLNPVTARVTGVASHTRRLFVWLPRAGEPVAIAHRIELQPMRDFPGRVVPYAPYAELEAALRAVIGGQTVAMEISDRDAVPYLDRVPWGVVRLVESLGARVVPSAALVTQLASAWSAEETADHRWAAARLAAIAQTALARAVHEGGTGLRETALQARVIDAMRAEGMAMTTMPIVAFGANAANPHYEPMAGEDAELAAEQVILLDLWGGRRAGTVFADQTWMGFSGRVVPDRVRQVWETVRDARDAAVAAGRAAAARGEVVRGFMLDRAARDHIAAAGFGDWFIHRTGHSIDRDLHGSGPHLDDFETHDDRQLLPGVGFSVEPGIYLPGEFGVRSEINVLWSAAGPEVTPAEPQTALIVAG